MPYKDPEIRKAKAREYAHRHFEKNREAKRAQAARWMQEHPEYRKVWNHRKELQPWRKVSYLARTLKPFGLTIEDYHRILEEQHGVCAICKRPNDVKRRGVPKRLAIDHAHTTGKFRGLLCERCNRALGLLREDPEIILAMRFYLLTKEVLNPSHAGE